MTIAADWDINPQTRQTISTEGESRWICVRVYVIYHMICIFNEIQDAICRDTDQFMLLEAYFCFQQGHCVC